MIGIELSLDDELELEVVSDGAGSVGVVVSTVSAVNVS